VIVQPETAVLWHRQGFEYCWRPTRRWIAVIPSGYLPDGYPIRTGRIQSELVVGFDRRRHSGPIIGTLRLPNPRERSLPDHVHRPLSWASQDVLPKATATVESRARPRPPVLPGDHMLRRAGRSTSSAPVEALATRDRHLRLADVPDELPTKAEPHPLACSAKPVWCRLHSLPRLQTQLPDSPENSSSVLPCRSCSANWQRAVPAPFSTSRPTHSRTSPASYHPASLRHLGDSEPRLRTSEIEFVNW